jgi:ERCC4-type nuclease
MIIKLDSREPPHVYNAIAAHPLLGIPQVMMLETGDIHLDNIIVERKEPNDLLQSIKDGRLFNQCVAMRAESEFCYLLICGQLTWGFDGKITGTGWNFRSVEGTLLQVQELGVGVVHAQNSEDLATSLAWLVSRQKTQHTFLPVRKEMLAMMPDARVLSSLPGIGNERALELLKERNLRDALLCLLDPACKVDGIGPKTVANLRQLFNLTNNQTLEVKTNE